MINLADFKLTANTANTGLYGKLFQGENHHRGLSGPKSNPSPA